MPQPNFVPVRPTQIAQDPQQRHVRRRIDGMRFAVDIERCHERFLVELCFISLFRTGTPIKTQRLAAFIREPGLMRNARCARRRQCVALPDFGPGIALSVL